MSDRIAWQVTDDAAVIYEHSFVPAIFADAAVRLADAAEIGRGERVLDIGCGTGAATREAARRVGAGGRVVGLDVNLRMLAVARRVAPEIEWRQGDAGELPFDDAAFDVVVSQFALMFFPDQVGALRGMWRVLAPRGRIAVAVCGRLADTAGYAALARVAERVCKPEVVDLLRSPFTLGDPGRLADLARAAGIAGAEVQTRQSAVRFPSIDALVQTEVKASPIRDVIDDPSFEALLQGASEALAPWRMESGAIAFVLPVPILTARKA